MTLITIGTYQFEGLPDPSRVPAEARLRANRQFKASDGTVVLAGGDLNPDAYQSFALSMAGTKIQIASGTAYATSDSDHPDATYTLDAYDAQGQFLFNLLPKVRISAENNPTTWNAIIEYSKSVPLSIPATWMDSDAIMRLFDNTVNSALRANSIQIGSTKLDSDPIDPNNPVAVGANSPKFDSLQPILQAGVNIKTINGQSPLGPGDIAVSAGAPPVSSFANIAAIIAHFGTSDMPVLLDANISVGSAVVFPVNAKFVEGSGKFVKSGAGTLEFQGNPGFDPEHAKGILSGFGSGDVIFSGSWYPLTVSIDWWDNASWSTRVNAAHRSVLGKYAVIRVTPGALDGQVVNKNGHVMHLTGTGYTDTWVSTRSIRIVMEDNTILQGDGMFATHFQMSSVIQNQDFIMGSGLFTPGLDGPNKNIIVRDLMIEGDLTTGFIDSGETCVHLGNCVGGKIQNVYLKNIRAYGAYAGLFSSSGYYADGIHIDGCIFDGVRGQNAGSTNGRNFIISNCTFKNIEPYAQPAPGTSAAANWNVSDVITIPAHGFSTGNYGQVTTTGVLPTGISALTNYYVRVIDANTFYLFDTDAHARDLLNMTGRVDITNIGSGNHTFTPAGDGLFAMIDFEPNTPTDTVRNVIIIGNQMDGTGAHVNWNGITVQNGGGSNTGPTNIVIMGNGVIGDKTHATNLVNGIQLSGAWNALVMGNTVWQSSSQGIAVSVACESYIVNNFFTDCSGGGNPHMSIQGALSSFIMGNICNGRSGQLSAFNQITEQPGSAVVNTSGTAVTRVSGDSFFPFLAGRTININGTDYVVQSVTDNSNLTLTASAGSLSSKTMTTYPTNTFANNKGEITLATNSQSSVVSQLDRVTWNRYKVVQITGNRDDFTTAFNDSTAGPMAFQYELTSNGNYNITGMNLERGPTQFIIQDGDRHEYYNSGSFNLTLKHESASSTAKYRFHSTSGADVILGPGELVSLQYNSTLARWIISKTGDLPDNVYLRGGGENLIKFTSGSGAIFLAPSRSVWIANGNLIIDTNGKLNPTATMTAGGTTGAQTINKPAGSVNFAAGAGTGGLVVTNSLVSASSIIICTVMTNDATLKSVQVVPASGSFTIYGNANATAETKVAFMVLN